MRCNCDRNSSCIRGCSRGIPPRVGSPLYRETQKPLKCAYPQSATLYIISYYVFKPLAVETLGGPGPIPTNILVGLCVIRRRNTNMLATSGAGQVQKFLEAAPLLGRVARDHDIHSDGIVMDSECFATPEWLLISLFTNKILMIIVLSCLCRKRCSNTQTLGVKCET